MPISYNYIFRFMDGDAKTFEILLDANTLICTSPKPETYPDWARLNYNRCENCSLDESHTEFCPIALNIGTLVNTFADRSSYENVYVRVITRPRDISKNTTIEEGLSSLLGIYMVTSGCPAMEKLKPMVRYHLPFATIHESVVRMVSMYLLIQYFLKRKGKKPDWELANLSNIYEDVRLVNEGISARLRAAASKDANINAIAKLDYLASLLPFIITDTLEDIEESMSSYL